MPQGIDVNSIYDTPLGQLNIPNMSSSLLIQLKTNTIINLEKLMYIKSDGHYLEFFSENIDKPDLDRDTMKNMIDKLPSQNFVRVHRSYIINIMYLQKFNAQKATLKNGAIIPLSRGHRLKDYIKKI